MKKTANLLEKRVGLFLIALFVFLMAHANALAGNTTTNPAGMSLSYEKWRSVGEFAAETAFDLIGLQDRSRDNMERNLVVLSNAGHANVDEESTEASLDGLSEKTGASRGRSTLIEIHSAPWAPLWFAFYDKVSKRCAYLEVEPAETGKIAGGKASPSLFRIKASERIDAHYLYEHPAEYKTKFENKIFGGNEFRIVTIANAVAEGAPAFAVRAFEFHDHYCPGVTSGILMAEYLKKHFPAAKGGYFVHSVQPWCKEDALLVLLNATPGKRSYAVSYPSEEDKKKMVPEAKNASTIVYRQKDGTKNWEGVILAFEWAQTQCPQSGNMVVDKLCADLWYLENMDRPEDFVTVVKAFDLPQGVAPSDWARPGKDPLAMLGMVE